MTEFGSLIENAIQVRLHQEWANRNWPLTVTIPVDNSQAGALERFSEQIGMNEQGDFIARDLVLSPKGIHLTFLNGARITHHPDDWITAWRALSLEDREYAGGEITEKLWRFLIRFRAPRLHGQRGKGRADKDVIDYLINVVHAYRNLMSLDEEASVPLSRAVVAVCEDAGDAEAPRYPSLLPDDGRLPWPESWTQKGATPSSTRGVEALRKRAQRDDQEAREKVGKAGNTT